MGLIVTPVKKGKEEEWKKWAAMLTGEKKKGFDDFNKRYGLARHDVWAVETPNGLLAVVLHEGPGSENFIPKVAKSDNDFDNWMKENIQNFHDMDLNAPPSGPIPVKIVG